ncbi:MULTISPECIES: aspartate aminotransferase family protein [unclassified Pseudovibrio]|uniref:aspartate aminotransferase family protein n=1 Tax=unclassified Pseudovibrio TaxID=2627060 RepID=UPI0007AEE14B|nr:MULTISPECIES: aspartate aminotransferase family protein [unclassified Pseudovibrio]KZK98539.1 Adenosylmethionine-8-amino-7-oxononanoate aminotransferase [Pseudovibrio sp. W74]KZL01799.1 Adenosylmethionine-8-amino-7-oxononanoate aminotransferase [Pseudovibrio sp. Ad5]KZL08385.1 Adenosylmethionine-8-amino-7-oxononanoate aminotransferase [Pseudovibrio sp. Ad14]
MSHIFPRNTRVTLPTAAKGDGCYLIDSTGKRYLDACGGAAVSCLGHSNEQVIDAIKDQLDKFSFAHTGFFGSEPAEELADKLVAQAPEGIDRVYLVSGGSEAMESAVKLVRQYFVEKGEHQRSHMIARWQSYHGNTLGALSAGGNKWRREMFGPLLIEMSHIDPCYAYRYKEESETLEEYGQRSANLLEEEILRVGPEKVAAFFAEPVVGATMGAVPAVKGYLKRIREICDKYGILLVLDEVMCGMGRTGHIFACNEDEVRPDIVAIAKGIGAGYQPLGAMLCSKEIYDTIATGSGFFQHGHTYMGHSLAAAAGAAVMDQLTAPGRMEHVRTMGEKLSAALHDEFGQHPYVADIRGRGLFRALELVKDRDTKEPLDPSLKLHAKVKQNAMKAGLMCYPMGGTVDGKTGDHILLAPPFIIDDSHITEIVEKLSLAMKESFTQAGVSI